MKKTQALIARMIENKAPPTVGERSDESYRLAHMLKVAMEKLWAIHDWAEPEPNESAETLAGIANDALIEIESIAEFEGRPWAYTPKTPR